MGDSWRPKLLRGRRDLRQGKIWLWQDAQQHRDRLSANLDGRLCHQKGDSKDVFRMTKNGIFFFFLFI